MIDRKFSKKANRQMWGFDIRVHRAGKLKRVRLYQFETRREAEEVLAQIRTAEKQERFGLTVADHRPTLAELIEKRLPAIDRQAERVRARRVLQTLLSVLPDNIRVDELTTVNLRLFVEKRQADGQANSSIDRELNIVAATLNGAADFFDELRQWRPPKIPRPKVSKSRRERLIANQEYRDLMAWLNRPPDSQDGDRAQRQRAAQKARQRVAEVLKFAMNTGMRPQEIFALRWDDIDETGKRLRVRGSKTEMRTNAIRYVPLTAPVLEVLAARHGFDDVFVFAKGGQPTPKIYRILQEACAACGIPYGRKTPNGFELYCARHTFTTRLLQSGLDLRTVGDITGHTDRELVLHYSHVTPESTARAMAAIEALEIDRLQ